MAEKVDCLGCGVSILQTTAARNGGLCEPCKRGTRASIEDSKRRAAEAKLRPPTPDYWLALVDQVDQAGYHSLSPAQRACYTVWYLEGEVYNGGFEQFFSNSAGDHYDDAVEGFIRIGATECLPIIQQAKQAVFGGDPVPARLKRFERLEQTSSTNLRELETLDRQFWKVADETNLSEKIEQFAIANNLPYVLSKRFHY